MMSRSFIILCFAVFVACIGGGIVVPILPIYVKNFGTSGLVLGVIFSCYNLSMALCTPYIGRLSDKFDKKLFIALGFALTTIIAISYVWVTSPSQLIFIRLLNGISIAMILPIIMAYIGELSPVGQEGTYMGLYSMSMFLGVAAGPVLGGIIVDKSNISAAFYACAVGMGIALIIILIFLPRQIPSNPTRLAKSPLREILASGPLKGLFVFGFILAIAQSGLMVFLPLLANNQKLSMSQIGILASIFIFSAGIMQVPFGWLANRWNRGKLVISSTLLVGVGLIFLPIAHGFLPLLGLGTIIGMASALGVPAANALLMEHSRKIGLGVVSGSFNASNNMGNIIGPIAAGIMMDVININYAFYLIAAIFIIGTLTFYYFTRGSIIFTSNSLAYAEKDLKQEDLLP
jgi:MFS transporter, DHA1 family, multidrug resistance protein